jgi:hypothetical protein
MIDAADAEMAVDVCEQMTLGRFIDALKSSPQNNTIRFRFASAGVGDFDSYRGYYDHIAIEPTDNVSTVGDVLASATYCLGRALSGYKGGKYVMNEDTPLWVAYHGRAGGSRVVGVINDECVTIIETQ